VLNEGIREDEYAIRRLAVEHNIPVVTTFELAAAIVEALQYMKFQEPEVLALNDYVDEKVLKDNEKTTLPRIA